MKNPNLVIDVGQTYIKFVVISNNYKIIDHIIINNNLLVKRKFLSYNISKLKNIIFLNIKKILKKHHIKKIIPITHGSASFYINNDNKFFSGPHFLQTTNRSFDQNFFKKVKKKDYTHSLKFDRFHNLGKSFYYLIINNKKLKISKIFTFPALINYILTNKLYLDKSYLACHSFAWNFKKKKLISFFQQYKSFFPKVLSPGKKIGLLRKDFSNRNKISVHNGIHDTSGSYLAFDQINNSLIINTGTYFIISKKIKFKSQIKKSLYCNYGADNNLYLCKRFNAGLIYQKFNPKMIFKSKKIPLSKLEYFFYKNKKKNVSKLKIIKRSSQINDYMKLNLLIAQKLSSQINSFVEDEKIQKIFLDGKFVKNNVFLYFLKQLVSRDIYINENSLINSVGACKLLSKKKLSIRYKRVV